MERFDVGRCRRPAFGATVMDAPLIRPGSGDVGDRRGRASFAHQPHRRLDPNPEPAATPGRDETARHASDASRSEAITQKTSCLVAEQPGACHLGSLSLTPSARGRGRLASPGVADLAADGSCPSRQNQHHADRDRGQIRSDKTDDGHRRADAHHRDRDGGSDALALHDSGIPHTERIHSKRPGRRFAGDRRVR